MSSNFTVKRICEHCKGIFDAKTTVTRFCGRVCNKRNYKLRQRSILMKDESLKIQALIEKPIKDLQVREFLNVGNVAELLGVSKKMIYRMIAAGQLKAVNLSVRKTIVHRKEIDRLFGEDSIKSPDIIDMSGVKPNLNNSYLIGEAQKKFSISEAGLYRLIKRHKISKYRNGRGVYVAKRELDIILM